MLGMGFPRSVSQGVNTGEWIFRQGNDEHCEIIYDWRISAEKPLLKKLTWLLRPLFSANHH